MARTDSGATTERRAGTGRGAGSVLLPGMVLGIGLGGLTDGIVLHRLLQWHHVLTERGVDHAAELRSDGLFDAGCWLVALLGVLLLHRRLPGLPGERSLLPLVAAMLAGYGAFDLVEGLINHQILGLHHVRPGPHQLAYDLGYLLLGAVLLVGGLALHRRSAGITGRAR